MALDKNQHPSLDRLNDRERELLSLLGRGHTAKSIATLKGLSVAAVNERFRNARRKTGLASSREIARLVLAQENRDDFIGLAEPATPPSGLPRPDAPRSRRASPRRRWRLPMMAAGLIAIALFAQQTSTSPVQPVADDNQSIAAQILARQPPTLDLAALHSEVADGPRDPAWSDKTENTLTQRYREYPGFDQGVQSFTVTCAATLCQAAGATRSDLPSEDLTNLMTELQTLGHPDPLPELDQLSHSFSTTVDRPPAFVFVSYWRRRD